MGLWVTDLDPHGAIAYPLGASLANDSGFHLVTTTFSRMMGIKPN